MSMTARRPVDAEVDAGADRDRQLVEAARTDPEAMAALYRRHVQAVYAYAFRICGSKEVAEEATSATFEQALKSLPKFEWQRGGVRPWLLRIAANEVSGYYRRRARADSPKAQSAMRDMVDIHAVSDDAKVSVARDREVLREVRAALPRLSARHREVLELRYFSGLNTAEAAEALGCSKTALAVTLHRALGALKREVSHLNEGVVR